MDTAQLLAGLKATLQTCQDEVWNASLGLSQIFRGNACCIVARHVKYRCSLAKRKLHNPDAWRATNTLVASVSACDRSVTV